jgi:thioredoxin reductase (NADPH)
VRSHCDIALVIRGDDLSKGMSSYLSRRVQMRENIELLRHTEIRKMTGNKMLEAVELENTKTHERRVVETPAIFSMIGAKPCAFGVLAVMTSDFLRNNRGQTTV